jgi:hypothetical protein
MDLFAGVFGKSCRLLRLTSSARGDPVSRSRARSKASANLVQRTINATCSIDEAYRHDPKQRLDLAGDRKYRGDAAVHNAQDGQGDPMEWHDSMDMRHHPPAAGRELSSGAPSWRLDSRPLSTRHGAGLLRFALTRIMARGVFAWLAWKRTTALLDQIDADVPIQSQRDDASSPRPAVSVTDSA